MKALIKVEKHKHYLRQERFLLQRYLFFSICVCCSTCQVEVWGECFSCQKDRWRRLGRHFSTRKVARVKGERSKINVFVLWRRAVRKGAPCTYWNTTLPPSIIYPIMYIIHNSLGLPENRIPSTVQTLECLIRTPTRNPENCNHYHYHCKLAPLTLFFGDTGFESQIR